MSLEPLSLIPALLLLIASAIDDLKTQKIHNKLLLGFLPFILISSFYFQDFQFFVFLKTSLVNLFVSFIITLPLVFFRFIGGGDFKLFLLLSLCLPLNILLLTGLYALPCAVLLGLFKILIGGRFKQFMTNLYLLVRFKKLSLVEANKIPFSVCLFFGFLSLLVLEGIL